MRNEQNIKNQTVGIKHSVNPYEDYSMCLTGKENLKTIVPVSDDIKNKIISRVHEDFKLRGGMTPENDQFPEVKKTYIMSSPPDKRISVGWTLDQIQINEARRIVDFIKSKDLETCFKLYLNMFISYLLYTNFYIFIYAKLMLFSEHYIVSAQ